MHKFHVVVDVPQQFVEVHPAFASHCIIAIALISDIKVELRSVFHDNTANDRWENPTVCINVSKVFLDSRVFNAMADGFCIEDAHGAIGELDDKVWLERVHPVVIGDAEVDVHQLGAVLPILLDLLL